MCDIDQASAYSIAKMFQEEAGSSYQVDVRSQSIW